MPQMPQLPPTGMMIQQDGGMMMQPDGGMMMQQGM